MVLWELDATIKKILEIVTGLQDQGERMQKQMNSMQEQINENTRATKANTDAIESLTETVNSTLGYAKEIDLYVVRTFRTVWAAI